MTTTKSPGEASRNPSRKRSVPQTAVAPGVVVFMAYAVSIFTSAFLLF